MLFKYQIHITTYNSLKCPFIKFLKVYIGIRSMEFGMVLLKPNSILCVFKTGGFCYSPLYPFRIIKLFCIIYVAVIVQSLSRVRLCVTPWTAACQVFLSITTSWRLLKLMYIKSVMPSNHLILSYPLLLMPSIFPSIRVFSNESALQIKVAKVLELQL